MYMQDTVRDYKIDLKNITFQAVVAMVENEEDKSLGFQPEIIFTSPGEVQTKFGACPYHEAAKRLNFHEPVCTFVCVLNAQYITENTPYQAEMTARIAGGDDHCIMKITKKEKGGPAKASQEKKK
jgi:predicted ArsR family transcriptional regulator